MLGKRLTGGLAAAAIAVTAALAGATPASAKGASFGFFFGSPGPSYHHYHHRRGPAVCRTQHKVVWRHGKKHRVVVRKHCPRVYAPRPYIHFHFRLN